MTMVTLWKKFSKSDNNTPDEWPAEAEQTEHTVENLRKVLPEINRKIASCYYSTNSADKKHKKIPLHGLASILNDSAVKMQDDELLSEVFKNCGGLMNQMVELTVNYENNVEAELMNKLKLVSEEDCHSVIKQRKQLTRLCNELKTARDRLKNCEQENVNKNNEESQNRLIQAQSQVYEVEREVDQCRDSTLRELYQFESREGEYAELFLNYMNLQASYHQQCLSALQKEIPQIQRIINEKRKKTVYGKNLEEHLRETGLEISYVIETCITALNKEVFLKEQGLFRIAGSKMKIDLLTSSLNVMEASMIHELEPAVIADALKQYFRSLPEPLLTYDLYNDWLFASRKHDDNPEEAIHALKVCCSKLSPGHYNNLRYLIKFLAKVNRYEEHNKMTTQNLGIVFGPNLLKSPPSIVQSSMSDMMNNSPGNLVTELLIQHADKLFPEEMFMTFNDTNRKTSSPKLHRQYNAESSDNHEPFAHQSVQPISASLQRRGTSRSSRKPQAPPPPPPVSFMPSVPPPKPPLNVSAQLQNQLGRTPEETLGDDSLYGQGNGDGDRAIIHDRTNPGDYWELQSKNGHQSKQLKNSSLPSSRPSNIQPNHLPGYKNAPVSATASLTRTPTTPSSSDEPPQPLATNDSTINSPAPLAYPESLSPLQSSATSATFSITPPQEKKTPPSRPPTRPPNRSLGSVTSPTDIHSQKVAPSGPAAGDTANKEFFDVRDSDKGVKKLKKRDNLDDKYV